MLTVLTQFITVQSLPLDMLLWQMEPEVSERPREWGAGDHAL